jgi:hypothetical protein
MYTVEDAELIIQAATESTYEEDCSCDDEDNNHDPAQQQNDQDLVQHHNDHVQNNLKLQGKPKSNFR